MGRTLILTMPSLRAHAWLSALNEQRIPTLHWPLTDIRPVPGLEINRLHERIAASHWVLLPSPSAVIVLMQALEAADLHWPPHCGIGLVGPGSQRTLSEWFARVPGLIQARVLQPLQPPFDARGLISHPVFTQAPGLRVLVLHRPDGQTRWLKDLVAAGVRLEVHALYGQEDLSLSESALDWLAQRARHNEPIALSIASRGAGRLMHQAVARRGLFEWLSAQPVLTHHPAIAVALNAQGFQRILMHAPGVSALVESLRAVESAQPKSP